MSNQPISTRPPSGEDKLLQEKFAEAIVNQSEQLDKLAQQLLTLELAIPGLYATALKLVSGDQATLSTDWTLYLTFGCWALALCFTLYSLMPQQWTVDRHILRQDPAHRHEALGIEDFFHETARYKHRLVLAASLFFFAGTFFAALAIF